MPKKKTALTIEERLQQALVPAEEQPYEVPENWVWVYGKNIFMPMESRKPDGEDFYYIDIDAIDNKNQVVTEAKKIKTAQAPSRASRKLHTGDTVFSLVRPYLKNIAYIDVQLSDCIASTGFFVCTPNAALNDKYLYRLMVSSYVVDGLNKHMKGDNSPSIRKDDIENYPFPLPPLSEQQRIVERIEELFTKLDEAKERLQEVADSFAVRKAAILHKAFTGELTKQWRLENGVSDESWEEKLLGDVCTVNPKKIDAKNLDDNLEVSFVPMAAVSDVLGEIVNHEVKNLQDVRTGFTNFSKGDVIFAKITPCMENGKSAIVGPLVNDIGYGSTEFYVLRCKEELNNKYLYHMVRNTTFRAEAKAVMTGAVGQQRVPKTFLQEYQLLLPTLPEQHEIVRLIDDLLARERAAQQAAEQALASIDLMKKSILARAFRGELGTNKASEASALELLKQVLAEN